MKVKFETVRRRLVNGSAAIQDLILSFAEVGFLGDCERIKSCDAAIAEALKCPAGTAKPSGLDASNPEGFANLAVGFNPPGDAEALKCPAGTAKPSGLKYGGAGDGLARGCEVGQAQSSLLHGQLEFVMGAYFAAQR